jgi:hypothetical protein
VAKANIKSQAAGLRKRIPAGSIAEGVLVSGKDEKLVAALLTTLNEAGIKSSRGEASQTTSGNKLEIIVGGTAPPPNPSAQPRRLLPAATVSGAFADTIPWDATIFIGVKPLSQP